MIHVTKITSGWLIVAITCLLSLGIDGAVAQEPFDSGASVIEAPTAPPNDAPPQGVGTDLMSLIDSPPAATSTDVTIPQDTPATGDPSEAETGRTAVSTDDQHTVTSQDVITSSGTEKARPASPYEDDRAEAATTLQTPSPDTGTADTAEVNTSHRPRDILLALWRQDVINGQTDVGFDAWLMTSLNISSPPPAPDSLMSTPRDPADVSEETPVDAQAPETQDQRTRDASERWLSRAGPVALGKAGRVVTVFGSAIPTAFCSPLTVCTIELEPGEVLTDTPSWGDAVRWQVVAKKQGVDTVLLEIKPADDAQITNLVIPTNRRLYTVKLVNDMDIHTPILAFHYPDTLARNVQAALEQDEAQAAAIAAAEAAADAAVRSQTQAELARSGLDTDKGRLPASELDFAFRVDGRAPFRPVRVFADGDKTYIDLPPNYRGAMPAIVAGPDEQNAALNTRVGENGTRLITDRVISDIFLQSGKTRVRVRKDES